MWCVSSIIVNETSLFKPTVVYMVGWHVSKCLIKSMNCSEIRQIWNDNLWLQCQVAKWQQECNVNEARWKYGNLILLFVNNLSILFCCHFILLSRRICSNLLSLCACGLFFKKISLCFYVDFLPQLSLFLLCLLSFYTSCYFRSRYYAPVHKWTAIDCSFKAQFRNHVFHKLLKSFICFINATNFPHKPPTTKKLFNFKTSSNFVIIRRIQESNFYCRYISFLTLRNCKLSHIKKK